MKRSVKAVALVATTLSINFALVASAPSVSESENVISSFELPQDDWKRERDEFKADVNRRIEKNQKKIAELRAEAKNKKADARKEYEEKVNDLEKQNKKMQARMNEYKDDTKDGWQSFKKEFNHDMDQLGDAISSMFENNKK